MTVHFEFFGEVSRTPKAVHLTEPYIRENDPNIPVFRALFKSVIVKQPVKWTMITFDIKGIVTALVEWYFRGPFNRGWNLG